MLTISIQQERLRSHSRQSAPVVDHQSRSLSRHPVAHVAAVRRALHPIPAKYLVMIMGGIALMSSMNGEGMLPRETRREAAYDRADRRRWNAAIRCQNTGDGVRFCASHW